VSKYARQIRVIGREAQKQLEATVAIVPPTFDGEIARRYFLAAGVRIESGRSPLIPDPRFADMHPAARDVALGAHYAVRGIMKVVG
jgi:hypothetical protein